MVDLGSPDRLWETHEAATIPACAWGRVRCENNSVGEIERVGYEFTIDGRTIQLVLGFAFCLVFLLFTGVAKPFAHDDDDFFAGGGCAAARLARLT